MQIHTWVKVGGAVVSGFYEAPQFAQINALKLSDSVLMFDKILLEDVNHG